VRHCPCTCNRKHTVAAHAPQNAFTGTAARAESITVKAVNAAPAGAVQSFILHVHAKVGVYVWKNVSIKAGRRSSKDVCRGEAAAFLKRVATNAGNAVGNGNRGHAAAVKRAFANAGNALGYGYRSERGTVEKRAVANAGNAALNHHLSNLGALAVPRSTGAAVVRHCPCTRNRKHAVAKVKGNSAAAACPWLGLCGGGACGEQQAYKKGQAKTSLHFVVFVPWPEKGGLCFF